MFVVVVFPNRLTLDSSTVSSRLVRDTQCNEESDSVNFIRGGQCSFLPADSTNCVSPVDSFAGVTCSKKFNYPF